MPAAALEEHVGAVEPASVKHQAQHASSTLMTEAVYQAHTGLFLFLHGLQLLSALQQPGLVMFARSSVAQPYSFLECISHGTGGAQWCVCLTPGACSVNEYDLAMSLHVQHPYA